MSGLDDFGSVVERHHGALSDIVGGSAEGFKALHSREDDATLANPFDAPVLGWEQIELTLERAASNYTWG